MSKLNFNGAFSYYSISSYLRWDGERKPGGGIKKVEGLISSDVLVFVLLSVELIEKSGFAS